MDGHCPGSRPNPSALARFLGSLLFVPGCPPRRSPRPTLPGCSRFNSGSPQAQKAERDCPSGATLPASLTPPGFAVHTQGAGTPALFLRIFTVTFSAVSLSQGFRHPLKCHLQRENPLGSSCRIASCCRHSALFSFRALLTTDVHMSVCSCPLTPTHTHPGVSAPWDLDVLPGSSTLVVSRCQRNDGHTVIV